MLVKSKEQQLPVLGAVLGAKFVEIKTTKGVILRPIQSFKYDVSQSGIPNIRMAILALNADKDGSATISGSMSFWKKGDTFLASEYNTVVKDGKAQIGDEVVADKDGSRVDGWLSIGLGKKGSRNLMMAMAEMEDEQTVPSHSTVEPITIEETEGTEGTPVIESPFDEPATESNPEIGTTTEEATTEDPTVTSKGKSVAKA